MGFALERLMATKKLAQIESHSTNTSEAKLAIGIIIVSWVLAVVTSVLFVLKNPSLNTAELVPYCCIGSSSIKYVIDRL